MLKAHPAIAPKFITIAAVTVAAIASSVAIAVSFKPAPVEVVPAMSPVESAALDRVLKFAQDHNPTSIDSRNVFQNADHSIQTKGEILDRIKLRCAGEVFQGPTAGSALQVKAANVASFAIVEGMEILCPKNPAPVAAAPAPSPAVVIVQAAAPAAAPVVIRESLPAATPDNEIAQTAKSFDVEIRPGANANIRSGPSSKTAIVLSGLNGGSFTAIAKSGEWNKVILGNSGLQGWVHDSQLK